MSPTEREQMLQARKSDLYPNQYDREAVSHIEISNESVDRMHDGLITNWNARVRANDTVWHLGDFSFPNARMLTLFKRLNGKIHFIRGNHDDWADHNKSLFTSYQDVKLLKIGDVQLWLSHYAHRVWPASHYGSIHLYGHSHGILGPWENSIDVGVDAQNYAPISFEEVCCADKINR